MRNHLVPVLVLFALVLATGALTVGAEQPVTAPQPEAPEATVLEQTAPQPEAPEADATEPLVELPVGLFGAEPMHGTCGSVQTECRSCPGGIKSCDYRICYTSGSGFHKDTIYCTPCGNFC